MRFIVTGGCGFIGTHFIRWMLRSRPTCKILNLDKLTYAGRGKNLSDLSRHSRYRFIKMDIASPRVAQIIGDYKPDAIVNFAAESHVDRSIHDASAFLHTNILGVQNLLDLCRKYKVPRLLQVSTDEVYGSIPGKGRASETAPLLPSSPYSASKASGDLLCQAAHITHGLDVVITRCTNNYGPWQFPEKLIPLMITNALHDLPLPVYGDGMQRRDWIHAEDHCRGILLALEKGRAGSVYNFGMQHEPPNMEIVKTLLHILKKPSSLIRHVNDRPGHDRRYAVNIARSRKELGWKPRIDFKDGLRQTVKWYRDHIQWWLPLKDAAFQKYYRTHYGKV